MQKRNVSRNSRLSHPELRERAEAQSENHAFRSAVLPMSLDRFRNKFGMTVKEISSLRGVSEANDVAILLGTRHWLAGLLRHYVPRNDTGGRAGFLFGWSFKSHVQPVWMALSAFTMAEILLSLTIIGVVAAITLPSLTGNINERTWNTQRKALYARFSQAIALMPALNGYGTYSKDAEGNVTDTATETFITNGLAKVLKINNICDNDHLKDCGIVEKFTTLAGGTMSVPKDLKELNSMFTERYSQFLNPQKDIVTKAAAFETANGESILAFYNPYCVDFNGSIINNSSIGYGDNVERHYVQMNMCANFIFDLNGNKGPNAVGKDIGWISALYPSDATVVMPVMLSANTLSREYNHSQAVSECKNFNAETRLPNKEELMSMFYNKELIGNQALNTRHVWSSSTNQKSYYWGLNFSSADMYLIPDRPEYIYCVKR